MTMRLVADAIRDGRSRNWVGGLRSRRVVTGALALVAAGLIGFAASAGRILVVDAPQPSDLVLVLAGETDLRPAGAVALLEKGYAPRVLLDVPEESNIFGFTELQLARDYVRSLPEAGAIEICPIAGLSTRAESHDVAACLKDRHVSKILIVTSDYHTRRALSIFRHEMPGRTFSTAAVHDPTQFGERWWTRRQWAKTCLDEWLRLFWWSAIERWI